MSLKGSLHLAWKGGGVFPLPITDFEELMLLDRRMPMDMWVEGCFLSRLNLEAAREALRAIAERHPLLTSRVENQAWVPTGQEIPLVHVREGEPWLRQPLYPEAGQGMQCYVVDQPAGCSLYFHISHACCDGTATRFIFLDFATAYARASAPEQDWPELTRLDPDRLPLRGQLDPPVPGPAGISKRQELLEIFRFIFPWPQTLKSQPGEGGPAPFSKRVFDPDETRQVFARAESRGAKLNEQALSDLFAVLADWQRERGAKKGRVRILLPIDMRSLEDRRLPACNRVTFAFLTRYLSQCGDDLTAQLLGEREFIKQYRTDLDFLRGLGFARASRLLPLILKVPLSLSTAVMTNMGDVTPLRGFPQTEHGLQIGDAVCHHATGATAVRPGTLASFSLCRLAGRLSVGLRCAHPTLGHEAERELLGRFTRRLLGA